VCTHLILPNIGSPVEQEVILPTMGLTVSLWMLGFLAYWRLIRKTMP